MSTRIVPERPDYWEGRLVACSPETNCHRQGAVGFLMTPDAATALLEILPEYLAASEA